MRRAALVVCAVLLLSACGGSPSSAPTTDAPTNTATSESPTIGTTPTPAETRTPAEMLAQSEKITLLPPSCTGKSGLRFSQQFPSVDEPAGTVMFQLQLTSNVTCTLFGAPRIALYNPNGHQLNVTPRVADSAKRIPAIVGPNSPAFVNVEESCPLPDTNPSSVAVRLRLRLAVADNNLSYLPTVAANISAITTCSTGHLVINTGWVSNQGSNTVGDDYAVNMSSYFDPSGHSTWGEGDLDGDGIDDAALLKPDGSLVAALSGAHAMTGAVSVGTPSSRIEGVADLNGDGRADVLAASTASGASSNYHWGDGTALAFTDQGGSLVRLGGSSFKVQFASGRGDLWAGFTCQDNILTQIKALQTGTSAFSVTSTAYSLAPGSATVISSSTTSASGDPATLTATQCVGLSSAGWATYGQ